MWLGKTILFREFWKSKSLQPLFRRLHYWALFALNCGGGGDLWTSGEVWLLREFIAKRFARKSHPVIFDVGANTGEYSQVVKEFLPHSQLYSFEPCEPTASTFEERTANLSGVSFHRLGFSDSDGSATIYSYDLEGESAPVLASLEMRRPTQHGHIEVAAATEIKISTIDNFCAEHGVEQIDLLKLDIEGHELKALQGARQLLDEGRIDVIQFEFGPANLYSRSNFFDFWEMLSPQYEIFRLLPAGMEPIPYYEEQLEIYLTTNYVAIRKNGSRT